MFFGLNVAPSESYFIIILFFIILCFIIYVSHEIFLQDKNLFILYFIIGLFPFLFLYYILEVISLPGFTQLQSNHGIFLFPILLVLIVKTSKYIAPIKSYFFIGVVFISQLIGINSTYRKNNNDWNLFFF